MEKQSQQPRTADQSGNFDERGAVPLSGETQPRKADNGQDMPNPFYEGVVGQPLPAEGEVSKS